MSLTRLSLTDFRSYADALIAPGPGLVVLTGDNGAGKTNVLEAISLLSPGRGLRRASLSEIARGEGPGGFGVAARLSSPSPQRGEDEQARYAGMAADVRRTSAPAHGEGEQASSERPTPEHGSSRGTPSPNHRGSAQDRSGNGPATAIPAGERALEVDLGTGTTAAAPERRQVRVNGAAASANALTEWLSVLWLTPAMDRLFSEAASGRRQFFDRLVLALDPGHARHAARYEAAMRARNKLLADPDTADAGWLAALEAGMAEHGLRIAEARARALAALAERLEAQPAGPFARAGLAFEGWQPGHEAAFRLALKEGRGRDAAAGRALAGPHRTDLVVTHLDKRQPAQRCSTGEQKALLLAIVLSHADLVAEQAGRRPILLLDEVAAHLDPHRREALFERLTDGGGQVWMTGTERSLFEAVDEATWLRVENGRIHA